MEQKIKKSQIHKDNNLILHNNAASKATTLTKIIKDSKSFIIKLNVGKDVIDDNGRNIKPATSLCIISTSNEIAKHEEYINIMPTDFFIMDLLTLLYKHQLISDAYNLDILAIKEYSASEIKSVRSTADKKVVEMKNAVEAAVQQEYDACNATVTDYVKANAKEIASIDKIYKKI